MPVAEKFMFDVAFDDAPEVSLAPEIEEAAPEVEEIEEEPVPTFSEEEVELARQQGYKAGKEEGLAATTETLTRQINESLAKIDQQLHAAFQTQDAVNDEMTRAAFSVAVGICKRMFPAMAEKSAFDEVNRVLDNVFVKLVEEPSVKIFVHASTVGMIEARINELSAGKGFKGRVIVQADETLEPGDCKVQWANGGSERNSADIWREITAIIERNIGLKPTIWDEPENLEPPTDLTAPEALVVSRDDLPETQPSAVREESMNAAPLQDEGARPLDETQQPVIDD